MLLHISNSFKSQRKTFSNAFCIRMVFCMVLFSLMLFYSFSPNGVFSASRPILAQNSSDTLPTMDVNLLLTDAANALDKSNINNTVAYLGLANMALEKMDQNLSLPWANTKFLIKNAIDSLNAKNVTSASIYLDLATSNLDIKSKGNNNGTKDNSLQNASSPTSPTSTNDRFNAYDNPILGIRMDYPSTWSVSEYPYNPAANNTVVGFLSPSKTGSELGNVSGVSGSFVPYLDLYVFDSKNMPIDVLFNVTKSKFLNNENFAIIESKPILLKGNRQAFELVYDAIVGGDEQLRKVQAYTIVNGKVYTISFTSQAALFADYLPTVHKMIYSFEAKGKNTTS
jgi:hypothetical protein